MYVHSLQDAIKMSSWYAVIYMDNVMGLFRSDKAGYFFQLHF